MLIVVVDTEEEFDWSKRHSRSATGVNHIRQLGIVQAIFERHNVVPTYVVDYPVASQEAGYGPLLDWFQNGKCEIGAHLHPWVNPPFDEELTPRNSYPGNLPAALEREKLLRLTDLIAATFGRRPTVYRAGRYGIGPETGAILEELGYEVDTSVVPFGDFRHDGGPDFTAFGPEPFWFGPSGRVLEIPPTAAFYGQLAGFGRMLYPRLRSTLGLRLHLPGVFARSRLLERICLTPEEHNSSSDLKRLIDALLRAGHRLFVLSYHSPSVVPGNTPYVRSAADLQAFLRVIEQVCEYFFGACRGVPMTLPAVRALMREAGDQREARNDGH